MPLNGIIHLIRLNGPASRRRGAWLILSLLTTLLCLSYSSVSAGETYRIYALACPFQTLTDDISLSDLIAASEMDGTVPDEQEIRSVWLGTDAASDLAVFTGLSDRRIARDPAGHIIRDGSRSDCAVLPVDLLDPTMKVIHVNHSAFPWDDIYEPGADVLAAPEKDENFRRDSVTTVLLTGTTALARTVAWEMSVKGAEYPGSMIKPVFDGSDITHISNEASIWSLCPEPFRENRSIQFCSNLNAYDLIDYLGVDVIELSGNHLRDYDWKPLLEMLDTFEEKGYSWYAAGRTFEEAAAPLLIEHNGNRFAFIGCNTAGPDHVFVDEKHPGANRCDLDAFEQQIRELSSEGYLVIATLQYYEIYSRTPSEIQERDFKRLSEAGAAVVSGSQAHFPQTMLPFTDRFIHYGLGNLFFDQMDVPVKGTRQEFLDRYVFYNGRLLNVQLITALLEDYSRPRLMTDDERAAFLKEVFDKCEF